MPNNKHNSIQSTDVQSPHSIIQFKHKSHHTHTHTHTPTANWRRHEVHHVRLWSRGEQRWCKSWTSGSDPEITSSRRLMSLTDQHTCDVEHGSTREVYDGLYSLHPGRCPHRGWLTRHLRSVGWCDGSTGAADAKTTPTRRRIWSTSSTAALHQMMMMMMMQL